MQTRCRVISPLNLISARRFSALVFAALCLLLLAGCGSRSEDDSGVQLILSTEQISPGTTFQLRFDEPVASSGGPDESPLVFDPPIPGKFAWTSPRSGVFTPAEPLALGTTYKARLRHGLRLSDGRYSPARLRRTFSTPAFGVISEYGPSPATNAFSEPEFRVWFNADVKADAVAPKAAFASREGKFIPAAARQGTADDQHWRASRTWHDEFTGSGWFNPRPDGDPDEPVGNLVVFSPLEPLPVGSNWTFSLSPGIPSADGRYRTAARFERPLGDVTPFLIESVTAHHELGRPPWVALRFSKPLPNGLTNSYVDYVQITPRATSLDATVQGNTLELAGNWRRGTHYGINVLRGLPAEESFKLGQGQEFEVVIPPIPPRLFFPAYTADQFSGGNRTFPLLAVNISTLRLRAKILDEHTAVHALRGYVGYRGSPEDRNRRLSFDLVAGRTLCDLELPGSNEPDIAQEVKLDWNRLLSGRKAGIVFLEAEAAGRSYNSQSLPGAQAIIQLTDLGLVWKTSSEQVQVFVFSYQTGRPLAQVKVRVCSEDNVILAESSTDDSGLATLPRGEGASWLTAQMGDDLHVVSVYENNIPTWWFEATRWQSHYQDARRAVLFLDRGAYRPGETAFVKAIVRDLSAEGLKIPAGLTGMVACLDSRGRQFFETNVVLSPLGSCETAIPLPTGGRGQYSAVLRLPGCEPVQPFEVADFQPSAFEVQLSGQPAYQAQDAVKLSLDARYHFGKNLERARIRWWLMSADGGFEPKGLENFQFVRSWEEVRWGRSQSDINEEGTAELNGSNLVVEVNAPWNLEFPQPREFTWYAEVTDLNQQTVSKSLSFVRHSSRFYLGLKRLDRVLLPGRDLPVQALAVDTTGAFWTNSVQARLVLHRVDWVTVRLQGAGRSVRYRSEPTLRKIKEVETVLLPANGSIGADRNVRAPSESAGADRNVRAPFEAAGANGDVRAPFGAIAGLRADEPGEYLLEITANDDEGNPVAASITFNISDQASLAWNYRDEFELKLVQDKAVYAPGETALLLAKAPFSGEALVTVERERVLRSFRTRLEGNAPSLRIPIEPGDAPNIYVSVTLVRGAADSPRQAREPEYRVGFCMLTVENPGNRLKIEVTPGVTNAQPGDAVDVAVRVRDSGDRPVADAEVTLYAVDEGVLMLTDYTVPDLHSVMFAPHNLAVSSSISLPLLLSEDPGRLVFQNKGYPGGGGGKERLRQHFLACAFWAGSIYADSQGSASVSFNAPDSITRYRLIAVAHNARNQFGQGVSSITVSKPLIIEPALPQSVHVGDQLVARAVVLNQTDVAAPVVVSLELDAKATCDVPQLSRTVLVAARGSVPVDFPVTLAMTGTAHWTWRARFASPGPDFTDAVRSTLRVGTVSPLLREVHTLRVTTPQTNLLTQVNPQLLTGSGTCTVHIANTRLVTLSAAVDHLLHYPYGCAEQTSSSLLPWIVLQQNPVLLKFTGKDPAEAAATARAGIQRLLAMQTSSGGLTYWPGANDPALWVSAYGAFVLAEARNAGLPVPPDELKNLLEYLKSTALRSASDADATCLSLAALAVAGQPEAALHTRWYEKRDTLSAENRALLALAIGREGNRDMARALIESRGRTNDASANFGSPVRTRATQLLAWTACDPGSAESAKLFAALDGERNQGHWITTQANAWAVLAMTSYLREEETGGSVEEGTNRFKAELQAPDRLKAGLRTGAPEVKGTLAWAGQEQTVRIDPGGGVSTHVLALDVTRAAAPLELSVSGSNVFVQFRLESWLPGKPGPGQDHGFGLQRSYEKLNDRNEPEPADALEVGDRVLVTLRLTSPQAAQYVALEDPLPGILEAINPEFRTQGSGSLPAKAAPLEDSWFSDYHEIRADRVLFFADHVPAGQRVLRYVARVRAAGTVTAPAAKVEEMYNPERFGLSDTLTVSARGSK